MKTIIAKLFVVLAVSSLAACASIGTSGRGGGRPMIKPAPELDRDVTQQGTIGQR